MSKKCPSCGNKEIIIDNYDFAYCITCEMYDMVEKFPEQTIFDRITKSVDTLAEEFVGMMYDRVSGEYRYYSMLTGEFYNSYEEAIAATVIKLKEVCND